MKKFPTLYSRASTGKIQQWTITADGDSFITESGQVGGKITVSKPNLCVGKNIGKANETSPEEQAILEAQAKWDKQIKKDYKEDINDIDNLSFFEPMLAKNFKDRLDKVKYPVIVDRKYNGGRLITNSSGQFTRKGEKYESIPHLFLELEPLFELHPDLVLDGEAYNHDLRFKLNELMSILRRVKNITSDHLSRSKEIVKYYVYDGFGFTDKNGFVTKDEPQITRRNRLFNFLKDYNATSIVPVLGEVADNELKVWELYNSYIEDGYEGAMVRLNAGYTNGRSSNLLKVKPEDDAEAIIKDVLEGDGNWSGAGKIISLKWKDIVFNATFKGTYEQGVEFLAKKNEWIGKEVTFLYNGLTGLGVPNYARVDINNCIKK